MGKYFSFEEEVNDFLTAIYKGLTGAANNVPDSVKHKNKTCKLLDKEGLI